MLEEAHATRQLQQMLQIVNVLHPLLIDSLLDDVPYLVIDRIIDLVEPKRVLSARVSRTVPRARRTETLSRCIALRMQQHEHLSWWEILYGLY